MVAALESFRSAAVLAPHTLSSYEFSLTDCLHHEHHSVLSTSTVVRLSRLPALVLLCCLRLPCSWFAVRLMVHVPSDFSMHFAEEWGVEPLRATFRDITIAGGFGYMPAVGLLFQYALRFSRKEIFTATLLSPSSPLIQ